MFQLLDVATRPVKRALLSAAIAWIAGVAFIMVAAYVDYVARYSSIRTAEPVQEFFQGLLFWAAGVGVVVFPTCLLVITPLLKLIPLSSSLRRPGVALLVGAAFGPIAMYVWAAVFLRTAFVPNIHDPAHLVFGCASAVVGAAFAFSYALLHRKARNI